MRYIIILFLAALIVGLDQWSKILVDLHINPAMPIEITGFFNLVNVRNYGAAFGFLSDPDTVWQIWLFIGITVVAGLIIFFTARSAKPEDRLLFVSLALVLGGALGNCIDRIRWGAVVDFLDVHVGGWHWPAFNVADIAICLGAFLMACLILFPGKGKKKKRL